jgi:hypothetical protein
MQDIAHWLKTLGVSEYARSFAENGMDLGFPNLADQDLQRRGSRQRCIRLSPSTTERRPPRCRLVLRGWPSASRANGSSRPSVDYRYRIFPFCQSLFNIFDMSDEIANNLYLVGIPIRDLHTGKFIFHQYHQLQTTEPVDAKIVTKVRFIYNSFGINTQILANKGAYFVSILTFLFQAWLSCAQAAESHSDLLIRC